MKLLGYSILLAAAFAAASARCPNSCSGHGDCNNDDMCVCWPGYQGFDCSERTCPMVEAWALDETSNPHAFAECGNRGICDRSTGVCQCFDGYTGRGCERSICPNACSGRGKCRILADLPSYMPAGSALQWDEKAMTACVCDPGFMGPDCSQRICPHGDDPMTACDVNNMNEVQNFEIWIPGHGKADTTNADLSNVWLSQDYAGITYTTNYNESFVVSMGNIFVTSGQAVAASSVESSSLANAAQGVEDALRAVPRQRLEDVTVSAGSSGNVEAVDGFDVRSIFQVTFAQTGKQRTLDCASPVSTTMANGKEFATYGCPFEGCQPRILQPRMFTQAYGCVNDSSMANDLTHVLPADGTSALKMHFTDDSLLVCPNGKTCELGTDYNYQAGIELVIYQMEQGGDYHLYAQGLGSQKYQAGLTYDGGVQIDVVPFQSIDNASMPDTTRFLGGTQVNVFAGTARRTKQNFDYQFLGMFKTLSGEIDVSRIIPGTKVTLSGVPTELSSCNGGITYPSGLFVRTYYSVAQCGGIAVAQAPSSEAENIECSRRGQCNRDTGLCECFDGYYGAACEKQTILV